MRLHLHDLASKRIGELGVAIAFKGFCAHIHYRQPDTSTPVVSGYGIEVGISSGKGIPRAHAAEQLRVEQFVHHARSLN